MRHVSMLATGMILVGLSACGSSGGAGPAGTGGANSAAGSSVTGSAGSGNSLGGAGAGSDAAGTGSGTAGSGTAGAGSGTAGAGSGTAGAGNGGASGTTASTTKGWLYTVNNEIYVSNGTGPGTRWVGRGVNVDDEYLCGYNNTLWMTNAASALQTQIEGLLSAWKPNFLRLSLGMASNATVSSWLSDEAKYKAPMTSVIEAIGAHPNTYVLVTLRSDASMIGQDTVHGDPEATGIPSDSGTTPNKTQFPTGTDAVYVALVDSFAHDNFVLFGLTNEAGGNTLSMDKIAAAMDHAVTTIRTEEDRLGVPHHLVSVQGNSWTSDISAYAKKPLTQDNVIYEVHGYPPATNSYTYANLPVIIGEYGSLDATSAAALYQDFESKQLSNLAWDFEAFSDCGPDLLVVTHDATQLNPTDWGKLVQTYLLAHAKP